MGTYLVLPDGSGWVVEKNRRTVSNHRLKQRAIDSAKSEAGPGDRLQIHRQNGTVQDVKTV